MEREIRTDKPDALLKEMDAARQEGEPLASAAVQELDALTGALAGRCAGSERAKMEQMAAAWREQFFAGYRLARDTGLPVERLLTDAPEGETWRRETLRLTRQGESQPDPEYTALADRWDDLLVLALLLGERSDGRRA